MEHHGGAPRGQSNLTSNRAICHHQALFAASRPLILASVADPEIKQIALPRGAPTLGVERIVEMFVGPQFVGWTPILVCESGHSAI